MPNWLIIMADDMRYDFVQFMPNVRRFLETPGRKYTACRTNVPICQPTRAGMLSGQYSKRHARAKRPSGK